MEDVTNEELLNEEGCRQEKDTEVGHIKNVHLDNLIKKLSIDDFSQEILVVPPIQSPPRSGLLNLRKQFQCHFCDYIADRQSNIIRHLRTHSRNQKFKCNICNFSAKSKRFLTRHTNNQHHLQLVADSKNEVIILIIKHFLKLPSFIFQLICLIFSMFLRNSMMTIMIWNSNLTTKIQRAIRAPSLRVY